MYNTLNEGRQIVHSIISESRKINVLASYSLQAVISLVQFLARTARMGLISKTEFSDFRKFLRATDGNYELNRLPILSASQTDLTAEGQLEAFKAKLSDAGIHFHVMASSLCAEDEAAVVAIDKKDAQKFSFVFGQYLASVLKGGEFTEEDLGALTSGRLSIINIPTEDPAILADIEGDMSTLGINFAKIPDLNLNDGSTQFKIDNNSLSALKMYYRQIQRNFAGKGIELGDFSAAGLDSYAATTRMDEAGYIDSRPCADEVSRKFEKPEAKKMDLTDGAVGSADQQRYLDLASDPAYVPITIDKATAIDGLPDGGQAHSRYFHEMLAPKGVFACRMPGTFDSSEKGNREVDMFLPNSHVFKSSYGGKEVFIGFVPASGGTVTYCPATGERAEIGAEAVTKSFNRGGLNSSLIRFAHLREDFAAVAKEGVNPSANPRDFDLSKMAAASVKPEPAQPKVKPKGPRM